MQNNKVVFDEKEHKYYLGNEELISTTRLLVKHNLAPDYSNVDATILKNKAAHGTEVHKEIENLIKNDDVGFFEETEHFANYLKNNEVLPLESELMVNNDIVAGTIDLILLQDTQPIIADIKTTAEVHYSSVSWQLSIYLYLFINAEKKAYESFKGQCFHFDNKHKLEVLDIGLQPFSEIERLMDCERNETEFYPLLTINNELTDLKDIYTTLAELEETKKQLEEQYNQFINRIRTEMEARGFKEYINNGIKIECKGGKKAYTKTNTKVEFNEEEFKKKYPQEYECYKEFVKVEKTTSEVKATPNKITITLLK